MTQADELIKPLVTIPHLVAHAADAVVGGPPRRRDP